MADNDLPIPQQGGAVANVAKQNLPAATNADAASSEKDNVAAENAVTVAPESVKRKGLIAKLAGVFGNSGMARKMMILGFFRSSERQMLRAASDCSGNIPRRRSARFWIFWMIADTSTVCRATRLWSMPRNMQP